MIQLGNYVFSQAPAALTLAPIKVGERKTRGIRGDMIKSGEARVKMIFTISGIIKDDFVHILEQFAYSGFLVFIPGELLPESPDASYVVSFDTFTKDKTGAEPALYSIGLEEK